MNAHTVMHVDYGLTLESRSSCIYVKPTDAELSEVDWTLFVQSWQSVIGAHAGWQGELNEKRNGPSSATPGRNLKRTVREGLEGRKLSAAAAVLEGVK